MTNGFFSGQTIAPLFASGQFISGSTPKPIEWWNACRNAAQSLALAAGLAIKPIIVCGHPDMDLRLATTSQEVRDGILRPFASGVVSELVG